MIKIFTVIAASFLLSGCLGSSEPPVLNNIEVRTLEVSKPAPIVPPVDQLSLRNVEWIVVTPENVDEVFQKIKNSGSEPVLFAISANGYENLSLNINDIRTIIQQQQSIIAIYKKQYE